MIIIIIFDHNITIIFFDINIPIINIIITFIFDFAFADICAFDHVSIVIIEIINDAGVVVIGIIVNIIDEGIFFAVVHFSGNADVFFFDHRGGVSGAQRFFGMF